MSISLMKVLDQIGEIAKANGEQYYSIQVDITHDSFDEIKASYSGYIRGFEFAHASTPEGVLEKLKAYYVKSCAIPVTQDIIIPEP